ncbi:helix-turn-helix domain-containing protein [Mycolicibacterium phlei]|uniref:helix-turn-helix domain-containing protein n=1 Tax=Mycolicibacterium phlei TaxID=1771 RepID=UPI0037C8E756
MDPRIMRLMAAIRAEAGARRISIKALAARAEISYPAIHRYLKGQRSMDLSQFYRIADALGVSVADLLAEAARTDPLAEGRVIDSRPTSN